MAPVCQNKLAPVKLNSTSNNQGIRLMKLKETVIVNPASSANLHLLHRSHHVPAGHPSAEQDVRGCGGDGGLYIVHDPVAVLGAPQGCNSIDI